MDNVHVLTAYMDNCEENKIKWFNNGICSHTIISNEYSEHRGAALGLFKFIRYSCMAIGGIFTGLNFVLPSTLNLILLGALLFLIALFQYPSLKSKLYSKILCHCCSRTAWFSLLG